MNAGSLASGNLQMPRTFVSAFGPAAVPPIIKRSSFLVPLTVAPVLETPASVPIEVTFCPISPILPAAFLSAASPFVVQAISTFQSLVPTSLGPVATACVRVGFLFSWLFPSRFSLPLGAFGRPVLFGCLSRGLSLSGRLGIS
jgi:hypothetical protein